MTTNIRPSDGRVSCRPHLDLNRAGAKAGDRVLFTSSGRWDAGAIAEMHAHSVAFTATVLCPGSQTKRVVPLQEVRGRLPGRVSDTEALALVEQLNEAVTACGEACTAARRTLEEAEKQALRKAGVR